jgi:ectoine hydroxylase-related dioxygenase (phytanoyl-CoA dioxygenase family)
MYRALSVFKPKSYLAPVGWHQDMDYWRGEKDKIPITVCLDNIDVDNGALRFISQSQDKLIDDIEQQEVFSRWP